MKIKCMLSSSLLILGLVSNVSAQLVAGSPEDRLFGQINAAADLDEKIALCLQFEEEFPESNVLTSIYTILMDIHVQRNETDSIIDYGERIIELDADNVNALMTLSRSLAVSRRDLPRAVAYGERAVEVVEAMKSGPPLPQFTPAQWDEYIARTEGNARSILSYARAISPAR